MSTIKVNKILHVIPRRLIERSTSNAMFTERRNVQGCKLVLYVL